jgi:hypothetical protein
MKVNSQTRTLKQTLTVNVNTSLNKGPNADVLHKKYDFIIQGIENILNKNFKGSICYQELYNNINDVLLFDLQEEFVKAIELLFIKYAEGCAVNLLQLGSLENISEYFEKFNFYWNEIGKNFSLLKKILTKFEKKIFTKNYKQKSIWNLCIFYLIVLVIENLKFNLESQKFSENLIQRILFKINEYRNSFFVDAQNVKDLKEICPSITFLNETGLYNEIFNDAFLTVTTDFYKNLSESFLNSQTYNIENYINLIEKSNDFENELIPTYLNEVSLKRVLLTLDTILLLDKKNFILTAMFSNTEIFIDNHANELLKKIYILFKRVKTEEDLKTAWQGYISNISESLYKKFSKAPVELFNNFLILKKNLDITLKDSFQADEKFKLAAKEGFTKAINLKPNFAADFLSRYIDHIFEEHDKGEKYIFEKVDEFMIIFKYLDAKDMFEGFYIRKLSARLLYNLTNSRKGEHYLIERLKHECGVVFVNKAEEMINDINTSLELTLSTRIQSSINQNFYVLSQNAWPVSKIIKGFVSDQVDSLHKNFIRQHENSFTNKILSWHLPYCSAEMTYKFKGQILSLEVNGIQSAILMRFTSAQTKLDFNNLVQQTGLLKEDLIQPLGYLVNKTQILKHDKGTYSLNQDYNPAKHHVILNNFNENEETNVNGFINI